MDFKKISDGLTLANNFNPTLQNPKITNPSQTNQSHTNKKDQTFKHTHEPSSWKNLPEPSPDSPKRCSSTNKQWSNTIEIHNTQYNTKRGWEKTLSETKSTRSWALWEEELAEEIRCQSCLRVEGDWEEANWVANGSADLLKHQFLPFTGNTINLALMIGVSQCREGYGEGTGIFIWCVEWMKQ